MDNSLETVVIIIVAATVTYHVIKNNKKKEKEHHERVRKEQFDAYRETEKREREGYFFSQLNSQSDVNNTEYIEISNKHIDKYLARYEEIFADNKITKSFIEDLESYAFEEDTFGFYGGIEVTSSSIHCTWFESIYFKDMRYSELDNKKQVLFREYLALKIKKLYPAFRIFIMTVCFYEGNGDYSNLFNGAQMREPTGDERWDIMVTTEEAGSDAFDHPDMKEQDW